MEKKLSLYERHISHWFNLFSPDVFSNLFKDKDFIEWVNSLNNASERTFRYDRKSLLPVIWSFWTAWDSTWRNDMETLYRLLLKKYNLTDSSKEIFFNPQKPVGEWKPEYAIEEANHLSDDAVIIFWLESKYSSVWSMAEMWFMALYSVLKAKKVITFIRSTDPDLGESVSRARSMSIIDAKYIRSLIPESYAFYDNELDAMSWAFWERVNFVKFLTSPIYSQTINVLMPRSDIVNRICISWTSSKKDSYQKNKILANFNKFNINYIDTHRDDWNLEIYENEELKLKDTSLINVVLITNNHSYWAVKDVWLAIFRAIVSWTYALIYFPDDTNKNSDYQRAKNLVVAHWDKLSKEFPWVNYYVKFVSDYEELIPYSYCITKTVDLK